MTSNLLKLNIVNPLFATFLRGVRKYAVYMGKPFFFAYRYGRWVLPGGGYFMELMVAGFYTLYLK
jgi:hypothetical protein